MDTITRVVHAFTGARVIDDDQAIRVLTASATACAQAVAPLQG
ncbi:hypothetical protein [Streptomyces sp. NPDC001205]